MLEEKMSLLKRELIFFATLVQGMIEKSITGLLKREKALLSTLIQEDEIRANGYESKIDEDCIQLIAQYEPKAKDLRTVMMIAKITKDLERMADHSVNISESGLFLLEKPPLKPLIDIPRMADITRKMLKDSIDAFVNEDIALAKDVCPRDNEVDNILEQLFRELVTYMISDVTTIERALNLIRISHNIERIADLSTNISEDVIFMVEGKVISHHKEDPTTSLG
ncbi:MAG: phosphate signaling complex protein PhoU [Candidatus Omnitrophota bacterium]|nr:phosphate signaling complex protein PhoU [Candidatus Omnitrophota bacterium]MDZ4242784.1 phosphate signaling complex protein PhoU [Candidatus Omnitrophota bacterium]